MEFEKILKGGNKFMVKKIKEYFEYRKSVRNAKRELIKLMNTTLPLVNSVSERSGDIFNFVVKLTETMRNIDNDKLVEMVLSEVSHALQTDNTRIIEILTYMANLSQQDIQKILVHSVVETMPKEDVNE